MYRRRSSRQSADVVPPELARWRTVAEENPFALVADGAASEQDPDAGWVRCTDPSSDRPYWFNAQSNESTATRLIFAELNACMAEQIGAHHAKNATTAWDLPIPSTKILGQKM